LLIKAKGAAMRTLTRKQISVCRLTDGVSLNGSAPSVEIGFHRGVLQARRDANVVLHYQSSWATVVACRKTVPRNFAIIPEIPFYIGSVAAVPYADPGSERLARAVVAAMRNHNLAILRNHGQVVLGADFDEALRRAVFFEFACQIIVLAGRELQTMTPRACASLDQRAQREKTRV
jgi:ribulose-5-phosphate 4-epimerase/fuculose-1-phosphate aldolase